MSEKILKSKLSRRGAMFSAVGVVSLLALGAGAKKHPR